MNYKGITCWVGVDWADRKHAYALRCVETGKLRTGSFLQKAASIEEWVNSLRKLAGEGQVAVALEQAKGGLIFALMKYDFIVLFPVNPNTVAKYREAWSPSGAKDDPTDALLLLELVEIHHKKLSHWSPEPAEIRLLQRLTDQRVNLVNDLKRVGNKLTSALKEYFPEVLELFPRIYRDIVAEFLLKYPSLEAAKGATDQELVAFFRSQKSGGTKLTAKRIGLIRNAIPLVKDSAIISSNSMLAHARARELKTLNQAIAEFDAAIANVYQQLPDRHIFDSLPSAGEISAPKLLAVMGPNRTKFSSAEDLLCFTGIAPVVEQSGKQKWTRWRYKCSKPLRQAFVEWAFLSLRTSFWAETFYRNQRPKGKSHNVAIRALAFKWARIIFRMWKERKPYDEACYLKALQKAGSPLVRQIH